MIQFYAISILVFFFFFLEKEENKLIYKTRTFSPQENIFNLKWEDAHKHDSLF